MVASIIAYSLSGSSARALKRFSQTPFSAQREQRLWVLLQPPNRSGKSRHGAPARNFQITASTKSRLPRSLLRPTVPGSEVTYRWLGLRLGCAACVVLKHDQAPALCAGGWIP